MAESLSAISTAAIDCEDSHGCAQESRELALTRQASGHVLSYAQQLEYKIEQF